MSTTYSIYAAAVARGGEYKQTSWRSCGVSAHVSDVEDDVDDSEMDCYERYVGVLLCLRVFVCT